jgi:hypothetical protein
MSYYCLMFAEDKTGARKEIQRQNLSASVATAYELFAERPELGTLELWQYRQSVFKLERSRAIDRAVDREPALGLPKIRLVQNERSSQWRSSHKCPCHFPCTSEFQQPTGPVPFIFVAYAVLVLCALGLAFVGVLAILSISEFRRTQLPSRLTDILLVMRHLWPDRPPA